MILEYLHTPQRPAPPLAVDSAPIEIAANYEIEAPKGSNNWRNVMAQDAYQGDSATKLSAKYSAPSEVAQTDTIHVLELPEIPDRAGAKLRVESADWFHRVQMESMGIGARKSRVGITTKGPAATTA
jgi:hypothetical protein